MQSHLKTNVENSRQRLADLKLQILAVNQKVVENAQRLKEFEESGKRLKEKADSLKARVVALTRQIEILK